ncbi:MAG: phage tail protein [Youngiibacter sp.]|nr:phage tail protein [Youngiibacter sp.]
MIKLFEHDVTDFSSLGLGEITKIVTSAYSDETLNGMYSAEFNLVYDKHGKWQNVTVGRIIYADEQPFRIYNVRKNLTGITAFCRHVFWDLVNNEVRDTRPTDKTGQQAIDLVLGGTTYPHPFSGFSDITEVETQYYINRNPVDCLIGSDSLRTRWGGDLKLDKWLISIVSERGEDRGVTVAYRKNMLNIEVDESYEGLITKMRPIGKDGLELPEVYVDSPYISNYPNPVIREVKFDSIDVSEEMTEEQAIIALRAAALAYFTETSCDIPKTNIKVDLVLLENTTLYKNFQNLVRIYLGDTITCLHQDLGISYKARVIRITKDLLTGKNAKVEIGSFRNKIETSFTKLNNAINDLASVVATNKSNLQESIDLATSLLNSALGGYVVKRNGELLIMDTENPETATKVWRWNINGLGYSSTGINGDFPLAMTMDGKINATFIKAGELDAGIIKTGVLQSANGSSWISLADGTFSLGGGRVTDSDIDYTGTSLEQALDGKADKSELEGISQYMDFDDTLGMTLGAANSNLKINLTNEQMSFKDGQTVVAYINGQIMYITSAHITNSLIVGNHKIEKYNDEITLVRWIG